MSSANRPQERPGDTRVLDCLYRVGAFVNATEDPRKPSTSFWLKSSIA